MSVPVLEFTSWYDGEMHTHLFTTSTGEPVMRLVLDRIHDENSGGIWCEISASFVFGDPDAIPFMRFERTNLMSSTASGWEKISRGLGEMGGFEWKRDIAPAIHATIDQHRTAAASHRELVKVDPSEVGVPFIIAPLVSSTGLTLWYSAPGVGKSMMALAAAVQVATGYPLVGATPSETGHTIYIDFEDDPTEHDIRYTALLAAIGWEEEAPVTHFTVTGKFADAIGPIKALIRELDVKMAVLDSMGQARGADASDGDSTIKLVKMLRGLGVPVLAIDHVTKVDNKGMKNGKMDDPASIMAIGSQFSTAGARLGWFIQEMSASTPMARKFNMHNTKHNHVAKQESFSMSLDMENNAQQRVTSLKFNSWDSLMYEELAHEDRAVTVLKAHIKADRPLGGTELGKLSGIPRATVVSIFNRRSEWWTQVPGSTEYHLTDDARVAATLLKGGSG
jgi:hypothetical protein